MISPDVFENKYMMTPHATQAEYPTRNIVRFAVVAPLAVAQVALTRPFAGMLPRELGKLQMLEALYLAYNNLEGEIPKELYELKKLQHLVMSQNQLSGALLKDLCKLRNLTHLLLNQNQLTGSIPKELRELKSLRYSESACFFWL